MNEPVAICSAAIIAFTALWSWKGLGNPAFLEKYLFSPAHILAGKEYYRLFTSGFLHADWVHFFFNAFSLYSFGKYIELLFGYATLLLIYFGSIVGGNLLSLYLHRHHEYRALGASGGVCGVIFASIFLLPGGGVIMFPVPVAIPSWLYAILFILVSFVGMRRQIGNVGHDAHLGGAVIGLVITTVLYPSIVPRSPVLYCAVMALAAGLFLYLWARPLSRSVANPIERWRERWAEAAQRRRAGQWRSEQQEMDRLLEKIARSGLDSLTGPERKRLDLIAQSRRRARGEE